MRINGRYCAVTIHSTKILRYRVVGSPCHTDFCEFMRRSTMLRTCSPYRKDFNEFTCRWYLPCLTLCSAPAIQIVVNSHAASEFYFPQTSHQSDSLHSLIFRLIQLESVKHDEKFSASVAHNLLFSCLVADQRFVGSNLTTVFFIYLFFV